MQPFIEVAAAMGLTKLSKRQQNDAYALHEINKLIANTQNVMENGKQPK